MGREGGKIHQQRGGEPDAQLRVSRAVQIVMITRREFVAGTAAMTAASNLARANEAPAPSIVLFSKPLQSMPPKRLAEAAKQIGFTGIDLTVRPGGHVLPERVAEDLPKAYDAIHTAGLDVPMITTELLSVRDPAAEPTLATAARLKIPLAKPGYYKYRFSDVRAELAEVAADFRPLAKLAQSKGVKMGFHNHTGNVGGPVWDIGEILTGLDPAWAGYYFDPAHAVAEGGGAGWKVALGRVAPRIFMTSIKDFGGSARAADGASSGFRSAKAWSIGNIILRRCGAQASVVPSRCTSNTTPEARHLRRKKRTCWPPLNAILRF